MTSNKRYRATEARQIIEDELESEGWDTASTFTVEEGGARPGSAELDWWHDKTPDNETSETPRSKAYLRAYLRLSQYPDNRLLAGGIPLERGRLWMDKSIISRLERDGYISFVDTDGSEPYFLLTPEGSVLVEANSD
jgi:hypothetical protein